MKAIINGLRYDTEKAELIGEYAAGSGRDFRHVREGLYKTPRSGRFFLAGEGGPLSRYAVSCGVGEWRGGSSIIPLDRELAREWAETNLSAEVVEAQFGDDIQDA